MKAFLQNLEQPRLGIRTFNVFLNKTVCLQIGFLDEVIGVFLIICQMISKGIQSIDLRKEFFLKDSCFLALLFQV